MSGDDDWVMRINRGLIARRKEETKWAILAYFRAFNATGEVISDEKTMRDIYPYSLGESGTLAFRKMTQEQFSDHDASAYFTKILLDQRPFKLEGGSEKRLSSEAKFHLDFSKVLLTLRNVHYGVTKHYDMIPGTNKKGTFNLLGSAYCIQKFTEAFKDLFEQDRKNPEFLSFLMNYMRRTDTFYYSPGEVIDRFMSIFSMQMKFFEAFSNSSEKHGFIQAERTPLIEELRQKYMVPFKDLPSTPLHRPRKVWFDGAEELINIQIMFDIREWSGNFLDLWNMRAENNLAKIFLRYAFSAYKKQFQEYFTENPDINVYEKFPLLMSIFIGFNDSKLAEGVAEINGSKFSFVPELEGKAITQIKFGNIIPGKIEKIGPEDLIIFNHPFIAALWTENDAFSKKMAGYRDVEEKVREHIDEEIEKIIKLKKLSHNPRLEKKVAIELILRRLSRPY